jgi:hypothetical protein
MRVFSINRSRAHVHAQHISGLLQLFRVRRWKSARQPQMQATALVSLRASFFLPLTVANHAARVFSHVIPVLVPILSSATSHQPGDYATLVSELMC